MWRGRIQIILTPTPDGAPSFEVSDVGRGTDTHHGGVVWPSRMSLNDIDGTIVHLGVCGGLGRPSWSSEIFGVGRKKLAVYIRP